ncbi:hypothetical protein BASA82_000595 [Batrachochytrium salamandrivorans]|nr:hypothetical protein BASA82_000595 [Batrachochytrium salamandrivorans]
MSSAKVVGNYELVEKIGSGSFSTVYRGQKRAQASAELPGVVAIKAIHLARLNPKLKQAMFDEVEILSTLHHENIVSLLSTSATANTLYLVLEFCGGDLHRYIRKHKHLALSTTQHFLRQLASGLEFLWRHNLIHRDLKPHNLLLVNKPGALPGVKIADFGFARHLGEAKMAQTMCGSPLYMCPELLAHQNYDSKCDLWSTGVIFFEMMTGHPPYEGASPEELLMNIQRTELRIPPHADTSPDALELLRRLLRRKPAERISYQEFFKARFIGVDSKSGARGGAEEGDGEDGDSNGGVGGTEGGGGSEEDESGFFAPPPLTVVAAAVPTNNDDAWEFVEAQRPVKPLPLQAVVPPSIVKLAFKPSAKRRHASGRAGTFAVEVGKRAVFLAKMSEQIVDSYEDLVLKPQNGSLPAAVHIAISASLVVESMRLLVLASAAAEDALEASAFKKKSQTASAATANNDNVLLVQQIHQWLAACTEKAQTQLAAQSFPTEEDIPNPKLVMYKVALGLGSRCASRELLLPRERSERSTAQVKREITMIVEDYSLGLMLLQLLTTNISLRKEDRAQILGFLALFCQRLQSLL